MSRKPTVLPRNKAVGRNSYQLLTVQGKSKAW
jgi:hypothetical protein